VPVKGDFFEYCFLFFSKPFLGAVFENTNLQTLLSMKGSDLSFQKKKAQS
jgi:hypothetical protein